VWPWWWWTVHMPHAARETQANCANGHKNVREAAEKVRQSGAQLEEQQREVRHGTRNIRMLLQGVLDRLERRNGE
jgi:hypothetical protein